MTIDKNFIALDRISVKYGETKIVQEISMELPRGKPVVIMGESGSGKTTLAKALMGLSPGKVTGEFIMGGANVLSYGEKRLRRYRGKEAALVVQALGDVLNPHMTVMDQLVDAMTCHGTYEGIGARDRGALLLREWHVPEKLWSRYPKGLSGGEVQRILLAMALSNDPQLLILDEPTAALDPQTCEQVTKKIASIAPSRYMLLFTHDFRLARRLGQCLGVLYGGQLLEMGYTERVFETPRHPYTRGLFRSSPERSKGKDLQGVPGSFRRISGGCPFANRCPQALPLCWKSAPPCIHQKDSQGEPHQVTCHRGGIVWALKVEKLSKKYDQPVLQSLSLRVDAGETVAVLGQSGSGKSTLARILCNLEKSDEGRIQLDPENSGGIALVPQHPITALAPHFSVYQAVAEPLVLAQKPLQDEDGRDKVMEALKAVELGQKEENLEQTIQTLSGGELQRVALARALITEPAVLVADEATSALDVSVQAKIVRLLMDLQEQKGLAMIFITHNASLAQRVSDRILVLREGVLGSL